MSTTLGYLKRKNGQTSAGRLYLRCFVALLVACAFLANGAFARNPQYRLCFRQYTGVPFTWSPPDVVNFVTNPAISGNIDNDKGWTNGFAYVFWNGTAITDGTVQAIKNSNIIYLSFRITTDQTFDAEDSIVLAFDPDGTNPNLQRIIIHPVVGGFGAKDPAGKLAAGQVEYYKGYSAGWGAAQFDPPWITVRARSSGAEGAPPLSWDVELMMDSGPGGLNLPQNSDFGLYINSIRVNGDALTATQFTWPANTTLNLNFDQTVPTTLEGDSLPPTGQWGSSTLAGTSSCSGVQFSPGEIVSNHAGVISLTTANQFTVTLHNTGTADAKNVSALFQIANYGLPSSSQWVRPGEAASNLIPGDPGTAPLISAGGGTASVATGLWTIGTNIMAGSSPPVTEHNYYQAHSDMCIRVQLDSTNPDTVFVNRSTWNNFLTGNASDFSHTATIGTAGYKLAPGRQQHLFDLAVNKQITKACPDPAVIAVHPEMAYSQLTYVVEGCLHTGQFIQIKKRKFESCENLGAFGYAIQHKGAVAQWTDELTGEGLERGKGGTYRISVPPGKDAVLQTHATAQEMPNPNPRGCEKTNNRAVGALLLFGMILSGAPLLGKKYRNRQG